MSDDISQVDPADLYDVSGLLPRLAHLADGRITRAEADHVIQKLSTFTGALPVGPPPSSAVKLVVECWPSRDSEGPFYIAAPVTDLPALLPALLEGVLAGGVVAIRLEQAVTVDDDGTCGQPVDGGRCRLKAPHIGEHKPKGA